MQTKTQSTLVAVFRDSGAAQAALNDLKASGFSSSDIYISNDTAVNTGSSVRTGDDTTVHHEGGITGWFKSIFGQEEHYDRPYLEDAANRGHVLLSATVPDDNVDRVADILERHSPVDVHREAGSETGAFDAASNRGATTLAGRDAAVTGTRGTSEQSIPVVRENLQIGKRTILRGGVRVYSRMVDEPVEEQVRLRDEHVRVDRTPVNREASAADLRSGQEQVFEVKEYSEEPVISKTSRVVEEIRVGKDSSEHTETVRDNVRHTEIKIDNLGTGERAGSPPRGGNSLDDEYRRDFEQNYSTGGARYEDYEPAYQYGYTTASDPRYKGRNWDDVEPTLRQEYGTRYPNNTWDRMKNSVRYGWDRVKAKV